MTDEPQEKPRVKVVTVPVMIKGAPGYMVSFGDMMTLILCFFILLVSMSKERSAGLMAKGVSSFIISRKSMGLTGIMDAHEKQAVHEEVRRRFNLPPEEDPERRAEHKMASHKELLRAETLEAMEPRREVRTPRVATFGNASAELTAAGTEYLDKIAESLRPRRNQILVLEGHAGTLDGGTRLSLAHRRAAAVRDYLVWEHGFPEDRTEARAWLAEIQDDPDHTRAVDARLTSPK